MTSVVVTLRSATMDDAELILDWRNDPAVYEQSITPLPTDPGEHRQWMDRALRRDDMELLIVEHAGAPAGVVRLEYDGSACTLSVTIDGAARGRGIGMAAVAAGTRHALSRVTRVRAQVRTANVASQRAFRSVGYAQEEVVDDWIWFAFEARSPAGPGG